MKSFDSSREGRRRATVGTIKMCAFGLLMPGFVIAQNSAKRSLQKENYLNLLEAFPESERKAIQMGTSDFDATETINAFLATGGKLYVPRGTYNCGPLSMSSDTVLNLAPGVLLKARPGFKQNECLLNIVGEKNVEIQGNGATIEMLKEEYTTGEWRHCVNVFGSSNIRIENLRSVRSGGDGFYVGGPPHNPSRNIEISGCIGDNNRRQGLSIVNAVGCKVLNGSFSRTSGTFPSAGIDIESNPVVGYFLKDIHIENVETSNNDGPGIAIVPQYLTTDVSISVLNCKSHYDGGLGWTGALWLSSTIGDKKMKGEITVSNMLITNPQGSGIVVSRWTQNAPRTTIKQVKIINCASNWTMSSKSRLHQAAIRLFIESKDHYGESYGHISFVDNAVVDNRAPPQTYIPVYLRNDTNKPLSNVHFINFQANKWSKSSESPFEIISNKLENVTSTRN
jgi:hypothetical protein